MDERGEQAALSKEGDGQGRFAMPPLLPWAVGLVAGTVADGVWGVPTGWAWAVAGAAALGLAIPQLGTRGVVGFAVLVATGLGAVLHHHAFHTLPGNHLAMYTAADPCLASVTGCVVTRPRTAVRTYPPFEANLYHQDRTTFVIEAQTIAEANRTVPVTGLARVVVKEPALAVREGARVEAFGWLYRVPWPRNPGAFDWRTFNARRGVRVGLSCDHAAAVRVVERADEGARWSLLRFRQTVRRLLLDTRLATGDESVSLLDAMVLGRRSGMDRDLERAFVETGCAHYLAVSGLHVGMLGLVIWWPCRWCGVSRRRAAVAVSVAVVAYALLADPRPPIVRAAVMTCAYCLTFWLRRPPATLNALCLAAIVLVVAHPPGVFDAGFQLSFITVAGILSLTPVLRQMGRRATDRWRPLKQVAGGEVEWTARKRTLEMGFWERFVRAAGLAACVALAAWLSSLPIVAYHFGRVAPWGWLNSLIAFPFVFSVMVLGFLKLAVGVVLPILAAPVDTGLDFSVGVLLRVMDGLGWATGETCVVAPPPWWLCLLYYAMMLAVAGVSRKILSWRTALASFGALVLGLAVWAWPPAPPNGVWITNLAVGRGTSTVLELPSGAVWLYDAGASGTYDPGRTAIIPYLRMRGVRRLAGIIVSHSNIDHFGGVPSILDAFACEAVYLPPQFEVLSPPGTSGATLLDDLRRRGMTPIALHRDMALDFGAGVSAEVLWPPLDAPAGMSSNDASVVLRVASASRSALLTGDIGDMAQQGLLERGDLAADVLVLPHHGSVVANTAALLDAVGAAELVRSTFVRDADSAELRRLAGDRRIHNTAELGALRIELDTAGSRVTRCVGP